MELRQELDRLLEDFIAHGPAGASLQVFQHDEPVYSRCIGYANVEKRQPFALDTICCLASMTKIIASAAVRNSRITRCSVWIPGATFWMSQPGMK